MSHHNIEDFKPLSVSPNFGVLARPTGVRLGLLCIACLWFGEA